MLLPPCALIPCMLCKECMKHQQTSSFHLTYCLYQPQNLLSSIPLFFLQLFTLLVCNSSLSSGAKPPSFSINSICITFLSFQSIQIGGMWDISHAEYSSQATYHGHYRQLTPRQLVNTSLFKVMLEPVSVYTRSKMNKYEGTH